MNKCQVITVIILQIVMLVVFGVKAKYALHEKEMTIIKYPAFQDVHVMIFIGFGFLMVFLKKHSWTSVALNMLIGAWSIQVTMLFRGMWEEIFLKEHTGKISLDLETMTEADFGAAAVLITFGAILGKVNAFQMMIIAVIEIFFYSLNQTIAFHELKISDIGGSITIHLFGAVFGICLTKALRSKNPSTSKNGGDSYISNLVAMIGTVFLFMYWPSFNGILASGTQQEKVYLNTILALCASTVTVFLISALINKGKFKMEDVLNATLAGGVIMGSSADLCTNPVVALIIGIVGGLISILGFNYLTPRINYHDTCGVTNLHALPGLFGGFIGCIIAASIDKQDFDLVFAEISDKSQSKQALQQFYSILVSLGIAIVSGYLTGKFMNVQKIFGGFAEVEESLFNDKVHFVECEFPDDHEGDHKEEQQHQALETQGQELLANKESVKGHPETKSPQEGIQTEIELMYQNEHSNKKPKSQAIVYLDEEKQQQQPDIKVENIEKSQ